MSGISCHDICPHDRYKLLCGVVVPRPFALVTTLDENGAVNAAPFRFFNVFSDVRGNLYAYERDTLVMHRESQAQSVLARIPATERLNRSRISSDAKTGPLCVPKLYPSC